MSTLRPLLLLLTALALGCAMSLEVNATSSMHRIRVKQSGDLPCFALPDDAATRRHASRLVMVHVATPQSAAMARDGRVVWSVGFPPAAVRTLQGEECLVYGVVPPVSDSMVVPGKLQLGVGYHVTLNTDLIRSKRLENRRYSGDFCLSEQTNGSIRVHDLWQAGRTEVSLGDACHELYRVPPGQEIDSLEESVLNIDGRAVAVTLDDLEMIRDALLRWLDDHSGNPDLEQLRQVTGSEKCFITHDGLARIGAWTLRARSGQPVLERTVPRSPGTTIVPVAALAEEDGVWEVLDVSAVVVRGR